MKTIMNVLSYIPKQTMAILAVVIVGGSAIAAPLMSAQAAEGNVEIESTVQVANVTAGDTTYSDSVDAKVDEVVKVQLWYHNREDAFEGDVAENLRAALDIPSEKGKTQTITSTVKADNSNTVTDSAQVNLSLDNAYLDYVEGSAKWRHNTEFENDPETCATGNDPEGAPAECYTTEELGAKGDQLVNSDGMYILEDAKPCFAYEATVTVLARVRASEVKVNKYVSDHDGDRDINNNDWKIENEAEPGEKLDYMIRFENKGNTVLEDVVVGDNLPDYMEYVPGSTYIVNGNNPDGVDAESDNVYQGGIRTGDYNPGGVGYVVFSVKVNEVNVFEECGVYTLKNVGVVRPEGMNEFYNTAHTNVEIPCEEQPTPQQPEQPEQPEEQPGQPEALPDTGPGQVLMAAAGTGAVGQGVRMYVASRKKLLGSLLNR